MNLLQEKNYKTLSDKQAVCSMDSKIITLTSKFLWILGDYQVKLFSCLNLTTVSISVERTLCSTGGEPRT
ncbi:transposase [Nostoc sp. NIES-4103]|nr:transposase [Nostoc sp. NIES-4103]